MAELLGRWQTAVDSNLNAYPGAKLLTFDSVAITTPKTTYSDPELTTPHPNPVVANGSGQFPQIFAGAGAKFYLVLTTAADVLVDDFEDVNALGDDGGNEFTRDFGLGGRLEISGADGVVDIAFGPPEGDDIGGSGRLGGWGGTQGDALELDFAEVEVPGALKITGSIESDGLANAIPVARARGTATAFANLDIPLDADFSHWQLTLNNWKPSSTAAPALWVQFSFDGGATYKAGATDYMYQGFFQSSSSTSIAVSRTEAGSISPLVGGGSSLTDGCAQTVIEIWSAASRETMTLSTFAAFSSSTAQARTGIGGGATNNKAFGKATHIRLTNSLVGSGVTTSCDYVLMGMP